MLVSLIYLYLSYWNIVWARIFRTKCCYNCNPIRVRYLRWPKSANVQKRPITLPLVYMNFSFRNYGYKLKGDLSCKMHFVMSFLHKSRCVGVLAQRQKIKPSLFLRTQISKNGATTELIQICVRYDVISEMWTHGTIWKLLSETMPDSFGRNMVGVYISIANTQS